MFRMWYTLRNVSWLYGGNSKCPEIADFFFFKCIFVSYNTIDLELLKLTFLVIVGFKYSRKTANPYTSEAYDTSIT